MTLLLNGCICYLLSRLLVNLGVWMFVLGFIVSDLVDWFYDGFAYAGFRGFNWCCVSSCLRFVSVVLYGLLVGC